MIQDDQGYLWMCTACKQEPTFNTIYELFNHKSESHIRVETNISSPDYDNPESDFSSADEIPLSKLCTKKSSEKVCEKTCKICHQSIKTRSLFIQHKEEHKNSNGKYQCEVCRKEILAYENFIRHLITHQSDRPKKFQCGICHTKFYNSCDLKRHEFLHTDTKPYMCEYCSEGFNLPHKLLNHLTQHTGLKYYAYECKMCKKNFKLPSALAMHMKTHSEKTVFCPVENCKFSCHLNSQLKQHMLSHSGEKPYQCNECGRCFARSNDMRNHILNVHHRLRPYQCPQCPKTFAQPANLKLHQLIHTESKPYLCNICGKCFNHPATLRKHLWVHNPDRVRKSRQIKVKNEVIEESKTVVENTAMQILVPVENQVVCDSTIPIISLGLPHTYVVFN